MNEDNIKWITLDNGQHVPIREGESKKEAVSKFLNKKMSRTERNKDKYDKVTEFKRRKRSNIKNETKKETSNDVDDENYKRKKVVGLKKVGNSYIPIREGEDVKDTTEEQLDKERETLYDRIKSYYNNAYSRKHTKQNEYYIPNAEDISKELEDKLGAKRENNEEVTREDVKRVIEDYRKRKTSNKVEPRYTGTEEQRLKQEKEYLEKEIRDLESGNEFAIRVNPENSLNYMMTYRNYMSTKDRKRYDELKTRYDKVLNAMKKR